MRTGKDRVEVAEVGGTVTVGDVQVRSGDVILGDDDGVVVIAAAHEDRVLEVAVQIAVSEATILKDALDGGSLRAARAKHGYHLLQRQAANITEEQ
jgi:regulator of RNase E activity RraA